jgi:hypothetical protein
MKKLTLSLALAGSTFLSIGCATEAPLQDVSCQGDNCDAFDSIKSLISDAKKLDLGDLLVLGAGYATEELNDALDVTDYASVELRPTEFYALKEIVEQNSSLNDKLNDIDKLVSGLAARFGESELTTEVNKVRADHLSDPTSDDKFFAESAFTLGANFKHNWGFKTAGIEEGNDVRTNIGFAVDADLEARIISAYDDELSGIAGAPLAAIKSSRGFIFPRKIGDVRDMRPGESFALKGSGSMGINLGAGVPLLVTEPTSFLTYSIVLTAGLRSQLTGEMDVQLIRMNGDEVVIDVGMEVAKVKSARVGLRDGWGVHGLVEQKVEIAGIEVDLGKLVDKALQKELNAKLNLISAEASTSKKATRMSVARMRFNLDQSDPEGAREEALAQALKGDLRLAQALANRGDSGVRAEFDLLRSGVATANHAGLEIFGMHFFTTTEESSGVATIQTPGGATSLMFESLHKEGGWFFESHGYGRTGLAGLIYDAAGGPAVGETNLFISVEEGDKHMEREKMLDHLDGLIVSLAGKEALEAVEKHTNALEKSVWTTCPDPNISYDCNEGLIENDATFKAAQDDARDALEAATLGLDAETRKLLKVIGDLKVAGQSVQDIPAQLTGPNASIVLDYRLDDGALLDLFAKNTGDDFESEVLDHLEASQVDRRKDADLEAARQTIRTKLDGDVEAMGTAFDLYKSKYLRLVSAEKAELRVVTEDDVALTLPPVGANAVEIRFEVDANNRPMYEEAVTQSIAQARSKVVTEFFDKVVDLADDVGRAGTGKAPHEEQLVAYGLLGLTNSDRVDLRVNIDVDTSGCPILCGAPQTRYDLAKFKSSDTHGKATGVREIGGGLFNIDSIIDIK